MAVGKKFSIDFQQATEISGNTQILVQPEGQPVEKASVEQLGLALIDENIVPSTGGNYPKMSVGFAENIVGDGSATEEEFSFRPTAGVNRNTLNDGAARIHSIKGRSVVWNQKLYVTRDGNDINGISFTQAGENSIILNGTATEFISLYFGSSLNRKANHYYLLGALEGVETTQEWYITDQNIGISYGGQLVIFQAIKDGNPAILLRINEGVTFDNKLISIICIDLTQEFGTGNEPLTVEEYYQRKPIGINDKEYNEGKLVNLVPKAIKTTGFNQFNGTYAKVLGGVQYYLGGNYTSVGFATEEGGAIEAITVPTSSEVEGGSAPTDRLYTPSQNGYIYANGDSICISLYWPTEYGNLYGTYKPYKPFERDLSWVAKYFPNGMRSAGNVADEIRFNSTTQQWEAVKRVSVVDLGSLRWGMQADSNVFTTTIEGMAPADTHEKRQNGILCEKYGISPNTSVDTSMQDGSILRFLSGVAIRDTAFPSSADFTTAMQGVMLNYELAEPIVTPITENINFDYDVSDYGTEELIVAEGVESAPLSASIEYSPNVLAILKNAPGIANDVDMLKSQLAALTAQLAALTATNNE